MRRTWRLRPSWIVSSIRPGARRRTVAGAVDLDAFVDYFRAAGAAGVAVPALNRIVPKP